jgi:hypothetical protein
MEPGEALGTTAQVAVTLAGFAGVVVAFRSGSVHEWHAVDRFRLQLLLTNSIAALTFCLIAMLLLSIKPELLWIWRGCSGLAVAYLLPFGIFTAKTARRFPPDRIKFEGPSKLLFFLFGILGIAAMLLQVYNLIVLNAFWAFFATIVVQLSAAAFQFVRLILIRPESAA